LKGVYVLKSRPQKIRERIVPGIPRQGTNLNLKMKSRLLTFFYHFRYENVIKFKNKHGPRHAPATLKKCILSVLTINSPPQSRETVSLSCYFWYNFLLNLV